MDESVAISNDDEVSRPSTSRAEVDPSTLNSGESPAEAEDTISGTEETAAVTPADERGHNSSSTSEAHGNLSRSSTDVRFDEATLDESDDNRKYSAGTSENIDDHGDLIGDRNEIDDKGDGEEREEEAR